MASTNNSIETVNAAAAAIVTARSRAQPTSVEKSRWGSFWSSYWCFGTPKTSKRITHAALVPEPTVADSVMGVSDNTNPTISISLPFTAPPSSPFFQSDPPSAIHSPNGLLTLTSPSITPDSCPMQAHIFTLGPYAHETQLVSPPVFSGLTTAAVTPTPEPMQLTTPSSPEVPFAQLLTSSLNNARRNSYHLISPGSANSASGASSPYPQWHPVLEFPMVDASKLFDSEKIFDHKWGSRLGSGTVTPDGAGLVCYDSLPLKNQISEEGSQTNSETDSLVKEAQVDHRVSFELIGESASKILLQTKVLDQDPGTIDESNEKTNTIPLEDQSCSKSPNAEEDSTGANSGEKMNDFQHNPSSVSFGSAKEFNFDSSGMQIQIPASSTIRTEWDSENSWTFFPLPDPGPGVR